MHLFTIVFPFGASSCVRSWGERKKQMSRRVFLFLFPSSLRSQLLCGLLELTSLPVKIVFKIDSKIAFKIASEIAFKNHLEIALK